MWRREPLLGRVNYAVVAKADRITGAADGDARTVLFQVAEALGSPYKDPRTFEERRVHRVIVVSSQEIKKEAVIALGAALNVTVSEERVTLIGGSALWELICEHMPLAAIPDLSRSSQILEDIDPDYRITAFLRNGRVQFGAEAKHPAAKPFRLVLRLPDTPAGQDARAAIERHERTGAPFQIDGKFAELTAPGNLGGFFPSAPASLEIGPRINPNFVLKLGLECETPNGTEALGGLEFKTVRVGSNEATLSNEHQGLPWLIRLVMTSSTREFKFTISFAGGALSAHRTLQMARFVNAMAGKGVLRLIDEDTGILKHSYLDTDLSALDTNSVLEYDIRPLLHFDDDGLNGWDYKLSFGDLRKPFIFWNL